MIWHSTHSTGIPQLDEDHQHIEEVIKNLSHATNPRAEKALLMDLYCIIIAHIRSKRETPEFDLTPDEEARDAAFLHNIRIKIWERDNAHITQLSLIRDLRQMLSNHVLDNTKERNLRRQNS